MKSIAPFYLAVSWFIATTVLLCLPGSAIPQHRWFDVLMVDKWVHIFLFSVLTFLIARSTSSFRLGSITVWVITYGVLMEFVQKWFIANRAFDIGDIAADTVGAILGFILARKILAKS